VVEKSLRYGINHGVSMENLGLLENTPPFVSILGTTLGSKLHEQRD
jgi:hypothetical protein